MHRHRENSNFNTFKKESMHRQKKEREQTLERRLEIILTTRGMREMIHSREDEREEGRATRLERREKGHEREYSRYY